MKTKTVAVVCVAAVVILSGCMGPSTGDGNQTGTGDSPPGISNGQVQNVTVLLESFRETLNGSYTANVSIQSRSRRGSRQITGYVKKGSEGGMLSVSNRRVSTSTGTQKSIAWSFPNGTGYTKVVTQNGTQYVPRGANVLSILTTQRFVDQLERLLGANTTTVGGVSTTTYEGETVWNVTASSTRGGQSQKITLFLTSSGNVRVIRTSSSGAQGGGGTFEIVFSNIGSTSVSPPDWIDEARNQTQSRSFRGSRPRAPSGS